MSRLRRGDRSRPRARGAEGDALRLRQPGPDRAAASRSTAARRCTPSTSSRRSPGAGRRRRGRAPPVDRRADRHGHHDARRGGRRYRGHDVAELARPARFEQVAELLWTGALPRDRRRGRTRRRRRRHRASPAASPGRRRAIRAGRDGAVASALGVHHAGDDPAAAAPAPARCRAGACSRGRRAESPRPASAARLAAVLAPRRRTRRSADAIDRALVLLADHELATSARSPCASPVDAGPARTRRSRPGWPTVQGALHGGAARAVHELLVECEQVGAAAAVGAGCGPASGCPASATRSTAARIRAARRCSRRSRLLPDPPAASTSSTTCWPRPACASRRRPNVDLGLGALAFVGGLPRRRRRCSPSPASPASPPTSSEELEERPLRYRGLAASRPGDRWHSDTRAGRVLATTSDCAGRRRRR